MNVKKTTATLFLFLLTLIAYGMFCAPSAATAGERKTITLSSPSQGWPPYIIRNDGGRGPDGILVDVLREISRAEGYELQQVFYPEKRGHMLLKEGRVDAVPKAVEWVDDPSAYLWTDPVVDSPDVVVSRQTNPIQFTSPEDLAGLNVGLVFGFRYPRLDPLISQGAITPHRANNSQNLLRMLDHGHLDCIVINPLVARWHLRNQADLSPNDFAFSDRKLDNASCRFGFTPGKRWKPFIARFNKRLADMKKDGRLDAIMDRYR